MTFFKEFNMKLKHFLYLQKSAGLKDTRTVTNQGMNYLWMQKPTALPMMSAMKLTIITQANLDAYQTGYQAQRQLYYTTENWLPRNKIIMSPVQPWLLAFANN
jgi:hypothetical protein